MSGEKTSHLVGVVLEAMIICRRFSVRRAIFFSARTCCLCPCHVARSLFICLCSHVLVFAPRHLFYLISPHAIDHLCPALLSPTYYYQ